MAKRKKSNKDNFYVDPKKLRELLHIEAGIKRENPDHVVSDELAGMMYLIAQNLTRKPNFNSYPAEVKEDMTSLAIETMLRYYHNYNRDISDNAFSYLTQYAYNSFIRVLNKEKRAREERMIALDIINRRGDFSKWAHESGLDPQAATMKHLGVSSHDIKSYHESVKATEDKKKKGTNKPSDQQKDEDESDGASGNSERLSLWD